MNHLIHETSPYLLQHAHNPVHWFAWGGEAFAKAKKEDKPIIVSIGYSTCHWCHVMERESFENEDVAALMNEHFVCIKVDREERPDVDQIYMEVVQIISGNGGWPLNCFLLPDGKPFFGGTYYPPFPAHQRPSWSQVLLNISRAFREQRNVVEDQANRLMGYLHKAGSGILQNNITVSDDEQTTFTVANLEAIFHKMEERFDKIYGGFGSAPKFPSTMSLQYLLQYYQLTQKKEALEHLTLSLDKMLMGGIYDQLGGGFARYATDSAWLIPHFEKMLYDNALLVGILAEAYKTTKIERYKTTIAETLHWVETEMLSPEGGFYSALDADSEGEEGKFYVWSEAEVKAVLGSQAERFSQYYDVSTAGNWEGTNILWRANYDAIAENALLEAKQLLLQKRNERVRPSLDDKILLAWNALMCTAYCQAFLALQNTHYKAIAIKNITFLLQHFSLTEKKLAHTYKNGVAKYDANIEDYAFLIEALFHVYQITFDVKYLEKAKAYIDEVIEQFYDSDEHLFYFAAATQTDLIVRTKDLYDTATPSGNATMLINLQKAAFLFDDATYHDLAQKMIVRIQPVLLRYASSFSKWGQGFFNHIVGFNEIAIVGDNASEKALALQSNAMKPYLIMASTQSNEQYPLLAAKPKSDDALLYICKQYACQQPVTTIEEALSML